MLQTLGLHRALKFFESDTTFGANPGPSSKPSKNREIRFEFNTLLDALEEVAKTLPQSKLEEMKAY